MKSWKSDLWNSTIQDDQFFPHAAHFSLTSWESILLIFKGWLATNWLNLGMASGWIKIAIYSNGCFPKKWMKHEKAISWLMDILVNFFSHSFIISITRLTGFAIELMLESNSEGYICLLKFPREPIRLANLPLYSMSELPLILEREYDCNEHMGICEKTVHFLSFFCCFLWSCRRKAVRSSRGWRRRWDAVL